MMQLLDSTNLPGVGVPLAAWSRRLQQRIDRGDVARAVEEVRADLWLLRRALDTEAWQAKIPDLRRTDVVHSILADPFSRHAQERPRGYPGDAPLLDWIYEAETHGAAPAEGTLSAAVFAHTIQSPACAAVRWRKELLSKALARLPEGGRALSLACGHLREVGAFVSAGQVAPEVVGLDQDPLSLAEAQTSLGEQRVRPLRAGVRELLRGELPEDLSDLDLAYSAGLYDYLDQDLATRVSNRLVERVRVGGTVLVANFLPDVPDVGFMEVVMDWHLIYRTEQELRDTFSQVSDRVTLESWVGPFRNIVYVAATRTG